MELDPVQERNFRAALAVAADAEQRVRLAFAIWSESRGYIYANDGRNTSKSPGVTSLRAEILRRSLSLPHDRVGSNGRSTGMLQQISSEVGGVWGDMAGTMDPAESARRYLQRLVVHDRAEGTIRLTAADGGLEEFDLSGLDPVAADVLRVQQPLITEARSSNYSVAAVRLAMNIADAFAPAPLTDWWIGMADNWDEAKVELRTELDEALGSIPVGQVRVLVDVDSGRFYAASIPGRVFFWIKGTGEVPTFKGATSGWDAFNIGIAKGLIVAGDPVRCNAQELFVIRDLCTRADDDSIVHGDGVV